MQLWPCRTSLNGTMLRPWKCKHCTQMHSNATMPPAREAEMGSKLRDGHCQHPSCDILSRIRWNCKICVFDVSWNSKWLGIKAMTQCCHLISQRSGSFPNVATLVGPYLPCVLEAYLHNWQIRNAWLGTSRSTASCTVAWLRR